MFALLPSFFDPLVEPWFTLLGSPVTAAEVVAFVLSIAMVLANLRVNPIGWPLAMVASALYALVFAHSRLYGEASLQLFFIVVAGWGWWQWLRGRDASGQALRVTRMTPRARMLAATATLALWPVLALVLDHATDSDVPWLDALPTVGSITGQILLGRKRIENWAVWLAVNMASVLLFATKGLWLTVVLYAIFALLSVQGWRAWSRIERQASAPPASASGTAR